MSSTLDEILNQSRSWSETIAAPETATGGAARQLLARDDARIVLFGCGSSYHLAKSAAHSIAELTGRPSQAVPASEVFLSPASVLPDPKSTIAVAISRSGFTTEVLLALEYLKAHHPSMPVIAITCRAGSPLAKLDDAIVLPWADEASVVMTQSWTNMFLAIQLLASSGRRALRDQLRQMPEFLERGLDAFRGAARDLGSQVMRGDTTYLGLGVRRGVADEAALKLREMAQANCQADNPLELRHGPISTITRDSTVCLLMGDAEREYLPDLLSSLRERGAFVGAIAPYPVADVDRLVSLPDGLLDVSRTILYLPVLQLLAYEAALVAGLDPDRPRTLDQVVVL
jgi:glucosamine--fructose-6-phosphate aminotransferase (isomerizing)